jgi:hypothetical protein
MWICPYEIDWPRATKSHFAAGIDAMQALVLATRMVGAEIYASDYHKSGAAVVRTQSRVWLSRTAKLPGHAGRR